MSSHIEVKKACCNWCDGGCCVDVHLEDGEVVKISGDRDWLRSKGFMCERAIKGALDYHTHPSRLNFPLKRAGVRGEGKWQRISWQQAMDEVAEKLAEVRQKYGPEAVTCVLGRGGVGVKWMGIRWCNLFGTPNVISSALVCGQPRDLAENAIYGSATHGNQPSPGLTKCVFLLGDNPYESRQSTWGTLVETKKQGAKIVAVDPRFTRTAEIADLWMQIRPGTDGALAYGLLNVIIQEELYDKAFVREWCLGFDQVKEFVRAYPPERVESITWIPKDKIIEAARLYATSKPAILGMTPHISHSHFGIGAGLPIQIAKCILRAITGDLDRPGGHLLRSDMVIDNWQNMHWDMLINHPLRKRDTISAEQFPMSSLRASELFFQTLRQVYHNGYDRDPWLVPMPSPYYMWQAILTQTPYPVKAMISSGMNMMCTMPAAKHIYEALKSSNLDVHVTMDLFMTPSGMLADYVLPGADWMETPRFNLRHLTAGEQSVMPKYERRGDYDFWRELGLRLGQGEYWPDTEDGMYDKLLEPLGMSFKELVYRLRRKRDYAIIPAAKFRKYEETGFATPSGKVELVPTLFIELGYAPLPKYEEPPRSPLTTPEVAEVYPLILITGRRVRIYEHSQFRQLEKLRQRHPDPIVQIHPDTATKYGINDRDWVYVETPEGRITQRAEVTSGIHPRVVSVDHGWWFPEQPGQDPHLFGVWASNPSVILPDRPELCGYQGAPPLRALLCRIYKRREA